MIGKECCRYMSGKAKTEYWVPTGNETQYFVQGYLFLFDVDKGLNNHFKNRFSPVR